MRDHREPYTTRKLHLAHLVVRFIYLEDMYIFLGKNFTSLEKKLEYLSIKTFINIFDLTNELFLR